LKKLKDAAGRVLLLDGMSKLNMRILLIDFDRFSTFKLKQFGSL